MQLNPVYGDEPLQRIQGLVPDPATPVVRQRARLASLLAGLDADQWAAPTRCEGWSVQDVIAHLVTTNQFWSYSIACGLAGEPSTVLSGFDPVATPAQLVESVRARSAAETLELFVASNDALAATFESLDDRGWEAVAESPPGHQSIRLLADVFRAPAFTDIGVEKDIVREEILEALDEDGRNVDVEDLSRAFVFGEHPLGYKITGDAANVGRFTKADLRRHFARQPQQDVAGAVRAVGGGRLEDRLLQRGSAATTYAVGAHLLFLKIHLRILTR